MKSKLGGLRRLSTRGPPRSGRILSWIDFEIKLWLMPKNILPKPDIVIVSSLSLFTILNGYCLKKRFGCKLVFEIRDIWPLTIIEEGGFSHGTLLSCFLRGWKSLVIEMPMSSSVPCPIFPNM